MSQSHYWKWRHKSISDHTHHYTHTHNFTAGSYGLDRNVVQAKILGNGPACVCQFVSMSVCVCVAGSLMEIVETH